MNEYINLTLENLEEEHLCCAIADKKHQKGVSLKKEWLRDRIKEGHIFRKLNANAKVFVEYAPLETAWTPIDGENYMYIYCLWVSGSFKNKGYGKELLEYVINDSKEQKKNGICIISSKKKKPFLAEKSFFEYYGFKVVDTIGEYELLALNFNDELPMFAENVKKMEIAEKDLTIYYTPQCPYTVNCIEQVESYCNKNNIKVVFEKIDTVKKAKNVPCIFNNWATFKDGKFISNHLLNEGYVDKLYK